MFLLPLLIFVIIRAVNLLHVNHLRCYEDANRSVQLQENCRACVLFIDSINLSSINKSNWTRKLTIDSMFGSLDPILSRRRHRRQATSILHQSCARQLDGPLYGYNQTHCFCDSNQCNYNIQRCIYEVIAKSLFSCFHGSNRHEKSLIEIHQKCRSCRLYRENDSISHYECLTFAEEQQPNQTHCTCQQPMCNQDWKTCGGLPSSQFSSSVRSVFIPNISTINPSSVNMTAPDLSSTENATVDEITPFQRTEPMESCNQATTLTPTLFFALILCYEIFLCI